MKIRVFLLDCLKATTVQGVVAMDGNAPTLSVEGAVRDSSLYDLAEPWLGVLARAYEAGISAERGPSVGVRHGPD